MRKFSKNKKSEEFFQGLVDDCLDEAGYTLSSEKKINISPKANRIALLETIGIKCVGYKYIRNDVEISVAKRDNPKYMDFVVWDSKAEPYGIIEIKSTGSYAKTGGKGKPPENQLIEYLIGFYLEFKKLPKVVKLLFISNEVTKGSEYSKEDIVNAITKHLNVLKQFAEGLNIKLIGQYLIVESYEDITPAALIGREEYHNTIFYNENS